MKKVLILLLALVLCLSVTACNNGNGEGDETTVPVEKTTAPGKIENDTYSNDYISFKVPAGFVASTVEGSDILSPATPNGDSISVLFSEKDGSFDQLTKEGLETELKLVDEAVSIQEYVTDAIDGTEAVRFTYSVKLDETIKLNITQIILNTEPNITITATDFTGTNTAALASLASSLDVK